MSIDLSEVGTVVHAFAAFSQGEQFQPYQYRLEALGPEEVEVKVKHCGICHSDLSMLNNDWKMTEYPFVGGHEVIGVVSAVGERVSNVRVGQVVGVGWHARSCMYCSECLSGDHNLCAAVQGTILGRHGGFADRVRCHWMWAIPIPEGCDPAEAGPLLCGGITVFNPILQFGVKSTDRVGVIGIGGLGHLAIAFLRAWGCEVTAFSTTPDKEEEARRLGADRFLVESDQGALERLKGSFDFIISTVNVDLPWDRYIDLLSPKGRLHLVGALASFKVENFFSLLMGQKSVSASPVGSPGALHTLFDFAARHKILPVTEHYPLSRINEAFDRLRSGQARYRLVLDIE